MKIFVDCRMINMSGIGRYIKDLIWGIAELDTELQFMLTGNLKQIKGFLSSAPSIRQTVTAILPFTSPIYSIDEQVRGSLLLWRQRKSADVFFFPHYNVPKFTPLPLVITVHDLIHFKLPHLFGKAKVALAKVVLKSSLKRASRIITVSKATAEDVSNFMPEVKTKIRVIHNFPNKFFSLRPKSEDVKVFKLEKGLNQYILYVGNRKPHKNLGRLLQAFERLKPNCPGLQLVIVGKVFDQYDDVASIIHSRSLQDVMEIRECSDDELRLLYYGAQAFVFPSLYEGFGLPPLEAMACGTPVVVSNAASLPEVVGDAGVYVDPYDVDDIARGIYRVLTDGELRRRLREKGLARARLFTWEKSARETLKVFEEVLEEKRNSRK